MVRMSNEPDPESFLPLHPRDLHVLLVLTASPLHGYGIVKAVEDQSEGRLLLDPANLYRSLRRLQQEGLVAEVAEPPEQDDDRRRRYYELTNLGHAVVVAEVERMRTITGMAELRLEERRQQ